MSDRTLVRFSGIVPFPANWRISTPDEILADAQPESLIPTVAPFRAGGVIAHVRHLQPHIPIPPERIQNAKRRLLHGNVRTVLDRCEPLRTAFIEWLIGPEIVKRENIKPVRIQTQRTFALGRPDIWVEARDDADKRHVAIVENKIDAREGEDQLSNYARILKGRRSAKSRTLVYLTKHSEKPDFQGAENIRFRHCRWFEVYRTLAKVQHADALGCGDLGRELLRLMEDWNMDGTLSAAHLRAGVIYIDAKVEETLRNAQNEAWEESRIDQFLHGKWMPRKNWDSRSGPGVQISPPIMPYGVRLKMAFRFDRRDADWNVDHLELPCPVVTLRPNGKQNKRLPQRPRNWTGAVKGMWEKNLWIRQPTRDQIPRYGDPLYDYYKEFFRIALSELREALEDDQ